MGHKSPRVYFLDVAKPNMTMIAKALFEPIIIWTVLLIVPEIYIQSTKRIQGIGSILSQGSGLNPLVNVLEQTHYTSESPVRYFFMKKL